jgi:hypothetical protein
MTMEILFNSFWTSDARERFIRLWKQYYSERVRHEALEQAGMPFEVSRRAEIHDEIVQIIQKISLHKSIPMIARDEEGKMILAYSRSST